MIRRNTTHTLTNLGSSIRRYVSEHDCDAPTFSDVPHSVIAGKAVTADNTVSLDGLSSCAIHFNSIFATLSLERMLSFLAHPERSGPPPHVSQSCGSPPFCARERSGIRTNARTRTLCCQLFSSASEVAAQLPWKLGSPVLALVRPNVVLSC